MKKSLYCLWVVVVLQGVLILGMLHWQLQTRKAMQTEELVAKALRVDRLQVTHISLAGGNGEEVGSLSPEGLKLRAASPLERAGNTSGRNEDCDIVLGFPANQPVFTMRGQGGLVEARLDHGCPNVWMSPHPDDRTGTRSASPSIGCLDGVSSDGQPIVEWSFAQPGRMARQYPLDRHHIQTKLQAMTPESTMQDVETMSSIRARKLLSPFVPMLFEIWEKYPETRDFPYGDPPSIRELWEAESFGKTLLDSLERRASLQAVHCLGQSIEIGKTAVGDKQLTDVLAALGTRTDLPPKVMKAVESWHEKVLGKLAPASRKPPAF